jgi:hypothetical protein
MHGVGNRRLLKMERTALFGALRGFMGIRIASAFAGNHGTSHVYAP